MNTQRAGSPASSRLLSSSRCAQSPDQKGAFQEILRELDQTRKEFAKASLQLTQQETLITHLKDAETKKDAVIAHLEDELKNVEAFHQQALNVYSEEAKTKELEQEHKIRYLELEVARLTEENNIYSRFEIENREIRQTVLQMQEQIDKLQRLNDDLKHKSKDDMVAFQAQLEEELKKRLAESEKRYQAEAYRALSEEAKIALQGNDHLQTVLQKQNDAIEAVLQRCKQLENAHTKMKIEEELSQQSLAMHQTEVFKLRKQLTSSKERCQQLEEGLKQRRIERASLELLYMEYETTRKELSRVSEKLRRVQRAVDRWKNRAMSLARDSSDGVGDGRRFRGGGGMMRAARRFGGGRAASDQAAASRVSTATTSSSEGGGGAGSGMDWDSMDERGATTTTEKRGVEKLIDPMTILSMWNVNYESWRPAVDTSAISHQSGGGGEHQTHDAKSAAAGNGNMTSSSASMFTPPFVIPAGWSSPSPSYPQQQQLQEKPPTKIPPPVRRRVGPTVKEERLAKDRELSVLSKRRIKSLPPQHGQMAVVKSSNIGSAVMPSKLGSSVTYPGNPSSGPIKARFLVP